MDKLPVPVVYGTIKVESYETSGACRKLTFDKSGRLELARNEYRELFIKASEDNPKLIKQYSCPLHSKKVKNVRLHSNFVNEGKASVVIFMNDGKWSQFMVSNCPPSE